MKICIIVSEYYPKISNMLLKGAVSKLKRNKIIDLLAKKNIQTRPFFWPMHKQKIFNKMKLFKNKKYPNAEYLSKNGFYLPSGLGIKNKEIEYVASTLNNILNN